MAKEETSFFDVENINFYQHANFQMVFENLPRVSYFCVGSALPSVSTVSAEQPSPFSKMYRSGDHLEFEDLYLTVLLDEDFMAWKETYKWLRGLTFPNESMEYYNQEKKGLYHDATIVIFNNSNVRNFSIKYTYCHPRAISKIFFDRSKDAKMVPKFNIVMRFDQFYFDDII